MSGPVRCARCRRREVANGLDGIDDEEHGNGDTGGNVEFQAEVQDLGDLEITGISDVVELNHTHGQCQDITGQDADENGSQAQQAFTKMCEKYHNNQCEQGDDPVLPAAVGRAADAAGHIVDGNGIERQANGKDDGPGYERREKMADTANGQAD